MKKLAVGCVVLLVLGIAGIVAVSYGFSRISSTVASAAEGFVAELSALPELERDVQKQGPYTPPPTGEPSREQVERLVEVQQAVRTRLGPRAADLERRIHLCSRPAEVASLRRRRTRRQARPRRRR